MKLFSMLLLHKAFILQAILNLPLIYSIRNLFSLKFYLFYLKSKIELNNYDVEIAFQQAVMPNFWATFYYEQNGFFSLVFKMKRGKTAKKKYFKVPAWLYFSGWHSLLNFRVCMICK